MRVARIRMIRGLDYHRTRKQKQYYYLCPIKNIEVGDCVVVTIFLENIDSFACAIVDELIEMEEEEVARKRIYGVCVVKLPPKFIQHCHKLDKARKHYLWTNGIIYKLRDPKAIEYEKKIREQRIAKRKALEEAKRIEQENATENTVMPEENVKLDEIVVDENLPVEEQLKLIHEQIIKEGKSTQKRRIEYCTILTNIVIKHPEVKPTGMATREWISIYLQRSPRTVQNYLKIMNCSLNRKAKERAEAKKKELEEEISEKEMGENKLQ